MNELKEEKGWRTATDITEEDDEQREVDARAELIVESAIKGKPTPETFDEDDEEEEELVEFDERWMRDFTGLTYLGKLEEKVEIPYHNFTVRTLKTGEKIKVTEMIKHLEDSIGYARAYRSAVVAAGLVLVDGQPLLVGSKKVDAIAQRYQYITDNWHDFVIDILYEKINELEGRVIEILRDMGIYNDKRQVATVESAVTAGEIQKD